MEPQTKTEPQSSTPPPTSADSNLVVPLPIGEYEVFLNFRGPDTRSNVAELLYCFLTRSKVRTFRDDEELRKGEGIWPNLSKAIHQSQISVPIFSPRYAESKWCLRELAELIEHQKQEKGHVILPIFYMVDPRNVRHQTGPDYKKAFDEHKRNNVDEEELQSWRAAMEEVGKMKGWHIATPEEGIAVADIVSETASSRILKNNYALETDELVGIDDQVERVVDRLNLGAQGVRMVGLYGIGGIGKTTIATAVYNKIALSFDRFSFVENIREVQKQNQSESNLVIQKKFISNILRNDRVQLVANVIAAKKVIRSQVQQFKILVVLDDVDEKFDFKKVLGDPEDFASGSRFIITSRSTQVMKQIKEIDEDKKKLYEVEGLSPTSSRLLFYKHAFRKDPLLPGFQDLSNKIVATTGRHPLALKILGSRLYREEKEVWEDKIKELEARPEKDVTDSLMLSYNDLHKEAQQIFLDIACFHIGRHKEIAAYLWRDCNFPSPINDITLLVQRSMLKIGKGNEFQMHDQLRDMGREIVRQENIEQLWMRSRIWSGKEGIKLLVHDKGTNQNQVKSIRVNSGSDDVSELDSACFTNLSELRYLDAGEMRLNGDFSNLLPNLKWVQLRYHNRSLPYRMPAFNMKNVIIFDVNVEGLGDGCIQTKDAKKLKALCLPYCSKMSKLPEFPESGRLEVLRIDHFKNREEDMDIQKLLNVKVLKLVSCELGNIKGGTIGMMEELRELNLYDINCNFDSLRRVIADIGTLSSLKILNAKSHYLVDVFQGLDLPRSLKYLITQSGFANIAELMELEEFIIIGSSMKTTELAIPPALDCISWINSSKLKSMKLYSVKRILMVDSKATMLPSSLAKLQIWNLDSEQLPNFNNLGNLTELEVKDCPNLQEVHGLGGTKSLQILRIYNAGKLTCIYGLGNLMSSSSCRLTHLEIQKCPLLREVLTFEQQDDANDAGGRETDSARVESLHNIEIHGCQSLDGRSLPRLSKSPKIKVLRIEDVHLNINYKAASQQYQLLEGLENLEELVSLTVHHLPKVQRLPSLSKLVKLSYLSLRDLPSLIEIAGLGELKMLKQLKVSKCLSLERVSVVDLPLSTMYRIELDLRGCTNLIDVDSDLSPLAATTRGELKVIIRRPHEPEEAIERNLLSWTPRFLWSH
ncbi:Disease resistance protein L6 [Linum grandiflorum]